MDAVEKLAILSDSAKYDVACSSSGSDRKSSQNGLGAATKNGICHTFSSDGRCVSLLKILMSNVCVYECVYCVNRASNDIQRATFSPREIADLTIGFYRRNYIEGLFLSSGIVKNPDFTMERMIEAVRILREEYRFGGYIHLKVIPGCSEFLIQKAVLLADRISSNVELPSAKSLKLLAPQKASQNLLLPFRLASELRETLPSTKRATALSMSTQMIVGASDESDLEILRSANYLYRTPNLKRVYYSAFIPTKNDATLPTALPQKAPPLLREHRLYQADWLMRVYNFRLDEIADENHKMLDEKFDPKISWALRNIELFPVEINKVEYDMLIRVPGIGITGAKKIIRARKYRALGFEELKALNISLKKAANFILAKGRYYHGGSVDSENIKKRLILSQRVAGNLF